VNEARWTLAQLRLPGTARKGDLLDLPEVGRDHALVAAYSINELPDAARDRLLERLLAARAAGARVLVVEPLARRAIGWWAEWVQAFAGRGGRHDEWRFPAGLPPLLARLDRAAGLDHRELTGRSLYLPDRLGT
jgi:hypothetical protein